MDNSVNRINYIDVAKGIVISLMVLCHCGFSGPGRVWIYSFHMPFFFFVSGFLKSINQKTRSISEIFSKLLLTLIIPFFIFSLIYCFGSNGIQDWGYIIYGSRNSLAEAKCATPMWFLPCFFLSSLLFDCLIKIRVSIIRVCLILLSGLIGVVLSISAFKPSMGYPFSFDVSLIGLCLMGAGFYLNRHNRLINDRRGLILVCMGGGRKYTRIS